MWKEIPNSINRGPGYCPKCGGPIEYGENDHCGNSYTYVCWCLNEECKWEGMECFDLTFAGYMEQETEEVTNGRRTNGRKPSNSQWDSENNN